MNASHTAFLARADGQKLAAIVSQPELIRAYEEFSYAEMPPVQAIVREVEPILAEMDAATRRYAVQSCGALVGEILAKRGYRVMRGPKGENRRGRIRRSRFIKTGTLFEFKGERKDPNYEEAMRIAREAMVKYRVVFEALAK
jgi:hypothetical protein